MTFAESMRYYLDAINEDVDHGLQIASKKAAQAAEQNAKKWGGPKPVRWNTSGPNVTNTFEWTGNPERILTITTATKVGKDYTSHVLQIHVDNAGNFKTIDSKTAGKKGPDYSSGTVSSDDNDQLFRQRDTKDLGQDSYYGKSVYQRRRDRTGKSSELQPDRVRGVDRVMPAVGHSTRN